MGEVTLTLFSKNWDPIKGFWVRESHGEKSLRRIKLAIRGFPGGSDSKESACKAGDPGSTLGLGRSPGEGNGNPLQYSCLENPMDRGTWWATVHGVSKSWRRLSNFTFTFFHFQAGHMGLPWWLRQQRICLQCRRLRFNPWAGEILWGRKWPPRLQYSCLENPTGRGAWRATVHAAAESDMTEWPTLALQGGHGLTEGLEVGRPAWGLSWEEFRDIQGRGRWEALRALLAVPCAAWSRHATSGCLCSNVLPWNGLITQAFDVEMSSWQWVDSRNSSSRDHPLKREDSVTGMLTLGSKEMVMRSKLLGGKKCACFFLSFCKIFIFIYLFGCTRSSLQHTRSFLAVACTLLVTACGV